jgi:hypothetical protein
MWTIGVRHDLGIGEWLEDYYRTLHLFYVTAHNQDGRRFEYHGSLDTATREAAEATAARIQDWARTHAEWTPINNRHWSEVDPVYGSHEYVKQGTEQQWAARERADDPFFYDDALKLAHMG